MSIHASSSNSDKFYFGLVSQCIYEYPLQFLVNVVMIVDFFPLSILRVGDRQQA